MQTMIAISILFLVYSGDTEVLGWYPDEKTCLAEAQQVRTALSAQRQRPGLICVDHYPDPEQVRQASDDPTAGSTSTSTGSSSGG